MIGQEVKEPQATRRPRKYCPKKKYSVLSLCLLGHCSTLLPCYSFVVVYFIIQKQVYVTYCILFNYNFDGVFAIR